MNGFALRRVGLVLILGLLLSGLVVPVAPAAADANDYWSIISRLATFRRDGVNYNLQLWIQEYGTSGEHAYLIVTRTRNPDGVRKATQEHMFHFPMNPASNRFTHPDTDLTRAGFDSAGDMGVYGRLDINFRQDRALSSTCSGHHRRRSGTLSGTVNFRTQTGLLGTITALPARATLTFSDGECNDDGGTGVSPCPQPSRSISASKFSGSPTTFSAGKMDGGEVSNLFWQSNSMLQDNEGDLTRILHATMPRSAVSLNNAMTSGVVEPPPGIWLSGEATYTGDPGVEGTPSDCGTDGERLYIQGEGSITGTLAVDFIFGRDRTIGEMEAASAIRLISRPR